MKHRVIVALLVVVILGLSAMFVVREQQAQAQLREAEASRAKLEVQLEALRNEALSQQFIQQEKAAKAAAPKGGNKFETR